MIDDAGLLALAGLTDEDFYGFLAVYESELTGRIVVVCRDPMSGDALRRSVANLYRQTHMTEQGEDGQTVYYFDRVAV